MINIKIVSYNIWFDNYERLERLFSLIDQINHEKPDIVCLQEVLPEIYPMLISRLNYNYSYPENVEKSYGCVILSKFAIMYSLIFPLQSRMERHMILVKLLIDNINIFVSNVHFESEFSQYNKNKINQYEFVSNTLNLLNSKDNNSVIILCADTNITLHDDLAYNKSFEWMDDLWKMENNKLHEFTYDYYTNKNLQIRNIKLQSRIDRMLINKNKNTKLVNFKLLTGMPSKIQPSDHHGIFAELNIST